MASYNPPKKNTAFVMYVGLRSQADTRLFQVNPTLATNDAKVSKDGGALANLTTLPSVIASSAVVKIELSSTEMNADNVTIVLSDASGGQWCDLMINLQTAATQFDDLAAATIADAVWDEARSGHTTAGSFGEGVVVNSLAAGSVTAAVVATGAIDADAIADNAIDAGAIATGAITAAKFAAGAIDAAAIATGAIDADALAADAGTELGTAVWATAARTLTAATNLTSTGGAVPITAGGLVSADVTAISTDTTAANNAESFFDGTGYAGTNNVIPTVTAVTTVNGLAAGAVTAAAIATGAIDADAIADNAIDAGAIATGAITAAKFAAGAIDAAAIATGAVDADALAADAVTAIQNGLASAASIAALNDLSAAEVNAEVVDALATDTYAELAGVPAAASSLKDKVTWLFMLARNERRTTASADKIRNDANSSDVAAATLSDDGTTFTRGEYA